MPPPEAYAYLKGALSRQSSDSLLQESGEHAECRALAAVLARHPLRPHAAIVNIEAFSVPQACDARLIDEQLA